MNLSIKHISSLLFAIPLGMLLGYVASRFLPYQLPLNVDNNITKETVSMIAGAIIMIFIKIIHLVYQDSNRSPVKSNGIYEPFSFEVWGSNLFGTYKKNEENVFYTTEFLTIFFIPIIPLRRFKVKKLHKGIKIRKRRYQILKQESPKLLETTPYILGTITLTVFIVNLLKDSA
jgi:hypothetical protein